MANIILVHGAFTGGWYWQRVTPLLRAAGHQVWAPSLTGAGERAHLLSPKVTLATHIEDIANVLRYEDLRDVVLVGHSYGGMVITGVADRVPERLAQLIYLDAAYPRDGQNATGGFAERTGDVLNEMTKQQTDANEPDPNWLLPPLPLAAYGVTDPADVAWIGDRRTPHPMATLNEPLFLRNGPTNVPRAYVRCEDRQGLLAVFGADPLQPMYEQAAADGVKIASLPSGHDAMIVAPQAVAKLLDSLAQESAQAAS